jgi:hypothetical protein
MITRGIKQWDEEETVLNRAGKLATWPRGS